MSRLVAVFASLLLAVSSLSAYTSLWVQHPQQTWRSGQGTIERAVLSVRPKGIYTQQELYLTVSARSLSFTAQDSVEIQLSFGLPTDAIITDLWLWIDDTTIVRGLHMDRWTASTIYEGIVKRRRDPALLTKSYAGQYQLRVYPLLGTGTRKVKITFLTRNEWTSTSFSAPLPTEILRASKFQPNLYMIYWPQGSLWEHPRITEYPDIRAYPKTDSTGVPFWEFMVPGYNLSSTVTLTADAPLSTGLFVQRYLQGNEGLYQLVMLPTRLLHLSSPRRVVVLFDFNPAKSSQGADLVLNSVQSALRSTLSAADSVNLVFSGISIKRAGEHWFGGDSAGIASAFASAGSNPITNYSSLPALLANGVNFIKEHGGEGLLWLVANTDQVADYQVANSLLRDILALMGQPMPVHVSDFNNLAVNSYYLNGQYYYGNQYFYENLARQTGGSNSRIPSSMSLFAFLMNSAQNFWGFVESCDLYTSLQNGFCYARYTLNQDLAQPVSVRKPIVQIGKFNGQFPLVIDMAGKYEGSVFSETITATDAEVFEGDSTAGQIWAGRFLSSMETVSPQTTELTRQILSVSLEERVLSIYTAFLALEPNDTIKACKDCRDESKLVAVDEDSARAASRDSVLQAYPNPFNAYVTIRYSLPGNVTSDDARLEIYNVLGQRVRRLTVDALGGRRGQVIWEATNDDGETVGSGVYFAILTAPHYRAQMKLMLLK